MLVFGAVERQLARSLMKRVPPRLAWQFRKVTAVLFIPRACRFPRARESEAAPKTPVFRNPARGSLVPECGTSEFEHYGVLSLE